ncbi:MAG: tetratricopeptide repeat protein [Bryobacteraceae bacterium]|nr:tetratricopeptide repeat protein [Bryobacteraceae bacterium]
MADPPPARNSSIAVLPFINMSPEPEQEFFCDGITEEILNSLTQISGLDVIARTSAFQFKGAAIDIREVGQRLGADLVIEGSVRKAGEQLRITAQAIETASGYHLWSKTFRRELKDIFAVQEEIAGAIADLLRVHAPARAPARPNLDAYTRYLSARFLIHQQTPEALRAAVRQLRELIALFPTYAPAYSGIASANGLMCIFGAVSGRDVYAETKEFAERGYALDPDSAETCTVLGGFRSWFEYRWKEAEKLYDRALKLQPAHATAHVYRGMTLLCQGHVDEAESSLRRSLELDPLSASDCARMAYLTYLKDDYRLAGEHLQRAFELDRDYPEARFYEGLMHFGQEDYESVVQRLSASTAPLDLGVLAAAHIRLGRRQAAAECVETLRRSAQTMFVTPLGEALATIAMNDLDSAFRLLSEAIDHRTNFINLLAVEPFFDPLRKDSRFPKLLKKLNLLLSSRP